MRFQRKAGPHVQSSVLHKPDLTLSNASSANIPLATKSWRHVTPLSALASPRPPRQPTCHRLSAVRRPPALLATPSLERAEIPNLRRAYIRRCQRVVRSPHRPASASRAVRAWGQPCPAHMKCAWRPSLDLPRMRSSRSPRRTSVPINRYPVRDARSSAIFVPSDPDVTPLLAAYCPGLWTLAYLAAFLRRNGLPVATEAAVYGVVVWCGGRMRLRGHRWWDGQGGLVV